MTKPAKKTTASTPAYTKDSTVLQVIFSILLQTPGLTTVEILDAIKRQGVWPIPWAEEMGSDKVSLALFKLRELGKVYRGNQLRYFAKDGATPPDEVVYEEETLTLPQLMKLKLDAEELGGSVPSVLKMVNTVMDLSDRVGGIVALRQGLHALAALRRDSPKKKKSK